MSSVDGIQQFGEFDATADYVLRLGGYCVVVRPDNHVAVVSTKGRFYLPGGGQNSDENPEQAAIREALEECGMTVHIVGCIGVADELVFAADECAHFRKRCHFFRAELMSEDAGRGEADHALVWLPKEKAVSELRHGSQRWAVTAGA